MAMTVRQFRRRDHVHALNVIKSALADSFHNISGVRGCLLPSSGSFSSSTGAVRIFAVITNFIQTDKHHIGEGVSTVETLVPRDTSSDKRLRNNNTRSLVRPVSEVIRLKRKRGRGFTPASVPNPMMPRPSSDKRRNLILISKRNALTQALPPSGASGMWNGNH
uniref:Uncharacterized protein n=1 Tax=Salmonella sp. TaxID=599 RepID=A0A482EU86_SALSP|nr:hypothetical protein [Salmonella sp.]QBM91384.1 hypothetical protein NNIBIDOC_00051 [Salmonella sp.]